MTTATLGKDTLIVKDRVFTGLMDGDVTMADLPNDLAGMKRGKNGNAVIAANATGNSGTLTIRVVIGSDDDKFLNSEYLTYNQDPAAYALLGGSFTKRVGDGQANVNRVVYKLNGGFVQKLPQGKDNAEGDTEQGVAVWALGFSDIQRSIS